jgi:PKD repeat protein
MAAAAGAITVGRVLLSRDFAFAEAIPGDGPYGPLGGANANGLQLPAGFSSRIVAVSGTTVTNSTYVWHAAPDGGACFPKGAAGWVYASNAELGTSGGGVGVIEFSATGSVVGGYQILSGTNRNCAGGTTPWYTWLSCEENGSSGRVYECDPLQPGQGVQRPGLGSFSHEAAVVDPQTSKVYLTEDDPSGRLYRFTPTTPGDLSAGTLAAARVTGSTVSWVATSANVPDRQATTTAFNGGEGAWIHGRSLYFTTKGNNRVYELGLDNLQLTILYDAAAVANAPLTGVDNVTVHPASGDLFVAEDGGNMEVCSIAWVDGIRRVSPFLRITGQSGSEVTGPAFSPDGTRLYLSSQRGTNGNGVTYEITGPFRTSAMPDPGSCGPPTTTTTTIPTTMPGTTTTTSTTTTSTTIPATTSTTVAPNAAPVARFTTVKNFLQVSFDGSTSSDADGSVVAWAWNFGDGATATGVSASRTYAAAGSYTVTLTVTDDDGQTAAVSEVVTVTAQSSTVFAQDTFARTSTNGLGTAEVGGPWTLQGLASNFAVNNGVGRITLPSPGTTRAARLSQVSARDVDARVDMSLGSAPNGSGGQYLLMVRQTGETSYGVRIRALPTSTSVQLFRTVNGVSTTLTTQTVAGYTYVPGDVMHVRLQGFGAGTTTLRASFWINNQPVPTTWLTQATDTTAALQAAGGVGVLGYLSSSSTGSVLLTIDNLAVTPV